MRIVRGVHQPFTGARNVTDAAEPDDRGRAYPIIGVQFYRILGMSFLIAYLNPRILHLRIPVSAVRFFHAQCGDHQVSTPRRCGACAHPKRLSGPRGANIRHLTDAADSIHDPRSQSVIVAYLE